MIKIALLVNKLGYFYRGGVNSFARHFQDVINNSGDDFRCDLIAMSRESISVNRLDRIISPFNSSMVSKYDIVFLADFHLYDEDDKTILNDFEVGNKSIMSYIHGPDSIVEGNDNSFIKEYVGHIFWDRELLMRNTIDRFGLDISNSPLTLPYFVDKRKEYGRYRFNTIVSQCRVASLKGIDRIVDASEEILGNIVIFGYMGDRIKTKDLDYYKILLDKLRFRQNVIMFMSPYGISSDSVSTLLSSCKAYLSATKYEIPGVYGIEYSAMEAMDSGCLPIIDDNVKIEYISKGAKALFYDDMFSMIDQVNYAIDEYDSPRGQSIIENNRLFLNRKMDLFMHQFKEVVR
jgi:hypothetical protein